MASRTNDVPEDHTRLKKILLVLFFLSGATALIYQVVWTRLLTLFFGSTTLAVSTVLTAFMGGLALGSALFGDRADTTARPVRLYAWLELFIGIYAIATPLLFSLTENAYIQLHQFIGQGFWYSALLRFGLAMLLLLPPTILMGGTLPVLSKYFLAYDRGRTGHTLSLLYFVNTAGAVIGTIGAGLLFLQLLGTQRLLFAGGVINLAIFWFAWRMQAQPADGTLSKAAQQPERQPRSSPDVRWTSAAILATFALLISGLAALVYEVAWTRVLTLVLGSSTYAFTIMLATFLAGIALGSAMISRFADKPASGILLLAFCQVLIGVFALLTASLFGLLPDTFVYLFGVVQENYSLFLGANFLICFVVMVPATIFMGASFPVAGAIVVANFASSGRRIGFLYAANTIGAILGAFLAGFVLIPLMGIQHTLLVTVFINLSAGLLLVLFTLRQGIMPGKVAMLAVTVSLIFTLVFVWQPAWDRQKMTSGPYAYAIQYQSKSIDERMSGIEQLYYREGPIATVSVNREGRHLRLLVDGKTDAGNFRDMTTQVLIGHLPLLLKPEARDVLVIGYASGITAGAVGRHDVESIDTVEIEPAMREASEFFRTENYAIMDDDRFRLIVDDGRTFTLTSKKKYDVIISEPSNPWQAGSSRLFTREAFLHARGILKGNGVMAQWMHLYGTDVESFRLVARTFASVFPYTSLWFDPEYPDVIFIGSLEPLTIDPVAISDRFTSNPKVQKSLARIGYPDDWSVMKAFLLGANELAGFAGTGELNTDSLPILEYRAPKSLYSRTALQDNLKAAFASKAPESFPPIAASPGSEAAAAALLTDWGRSLAGIKNLNNAKGALHHAAMLDPRSAEPLYVLGYLCMHTEDITGAIDAYEKALQLEPDNGSTYANLGTLYYRQGEAEKAYQYLKQSIARGEDSAHIRNNLSVALVRMGRLEEAIREVETALSLDRNDAAAQANLARFRQLLEDKNRRH